MHRNVLSPAWLTWIKHAGGCSSLRVVKFDRVFDPAQVVSRDLRQYSQNNMIFPLGFGEG
jgi:hypothetical protein